MVQAKKEQIFKSAEDRCAKEGVRFTNQRKEVFKILLSEKRALSAYEIVEHLKAAEGVVMPVMSVYRALEFLEQRKLVHKITSINKYSVCTHITCEHRHEMPRLAVCLKCQKVDEVASNSSIKESIQTGLNDIGFSLQSQQLELVGYCSSCNDAPS